MDIGRNEPCPCGSGKKYKRCCGAPTADLTADAARHVRAIQEDLEPRIDRYARAQIGEDVFDLAWADFLLDTEGIDSVESEIQAFRPWMLYRWVPSDREKRSGRRGLSHLPLAAAFQEEHAKILAPDEHEIIHRTCVAPFSFHEVLAVETGRSLRLKDVITEREAFVFEISGSRALEVGDILFARVVEFDRVALVIGSGAIALPPDFKIPLLKTRKEMRKDLGRIDTLAHLGCDDVLRMAYFAFREQILHPPAPVLQNTDGEPMEMHTLTWTIDSPEAALQALAPLTFDTTLDELRREATLDASGRVVKASLDWAKAGNKLNPGWTNTILGHVVIDGAKLTVEVNSARRAERITREVAKRLRGHAAGPSVERRTMEDLRALPDATPSSRTSAGLTEEDASLHSPELAEFMRRQEDAHWDSWISERIPALDNRRPLQLVKTAEGREMVEALLRSFERHPRPASLGPPYDLDRVRKRLGLPVRRESSL